MFKDMGISVSINVHTDAEAAKGIASRTGLGKTRHIAVHYLWVQECVRLGKFKLFKVRGDDNPADLLTKHLLSDRLRHLMKLFSATVREGRSAVTPAI